MPSDTRKYASVSFYGSLRGSCKERGLVALAVCSKRKPPARGIGLRIKIHWSWCGPWFCNACAHYHEKEAAKAALAAGSAVYKKYTINSTTLTLFDGRPTDHQMTKARRMRKAAAKKLAALGYWVKVQDDSGGTELVRPTKRWARDSRCTHHDYGGATPMENYRIRVRSGLPGHAFTY